VQSQFFEKQPIFYLYEMHSVELIKHYLNACKLRL